MIQDYELELTTKDGQDITATAFGTKAIDLKAAQDAAAGEPLNVFMQVVDADFDNLTSLDVAIIAATDSTGTSPTTVLTKNYLLAALTTALGVRRVGTLPPGAASKQYLLAKMTVNGSAPANGAIKVWIAPGLNVAPANDARSF
jgi:hypothetical protein